MKPLTTAEVLILGLIFTEPMHGYDLDKFIKDRGVRQWANVGFSSIYYLLDKLEAKNLVSTLGSNGKLRKVYSITDEGKKICIEQTQQLISRRVANKNPLMTGLANSEILPKGSFSRMLKLRLKDIDSQLAVLQVMAKPEDALPLSALRLFSYSKMQIISEKNWIREQLKNIEE